MKKILKILIRKIVSVESMWVVIKPFAKLGAFAHNSRPISPMVIDQRNNPFLHIFSDKTVLHGPFQGMKYPSFLSVGSCFYPKLLGSYEKELHQVIETFLVENYTEILDIGCAEGYYAVGFAKRCARSIVYAFDTNETARNLCHEMAKLNNVEHRIIINEKCTPKELENFKFTGNGLIICDCEGYEAYLFNGENIKNLNNCTLLIEAHDLFDLRISDNLINLFSKTHDIQTIKSIDDIEKAKTYSCDETKNLDVYTKMELYCELRPTIMEWLICRPKL